MQVLGSLLMAQSVRVTDYVLDDSALILGRSWDFSSYHKVQTSSGAHPVGTGALFLVVK
jgi:hypothetical protein